MNLIKGYLHHVGEIRDDFVVSIQKTKQIKKKAKPKKKKNNVQERPSEIIIYKWYFKLYCSTTNVIHMVIIMLTWNTDYSDFTSQMKILDLAM